MKYMGGMYMKISGKEAYSVMLSDSPDIMNIEEMCSALSISKKTGYKLLREGKIVGMKVGRTYRCLLYTSDAADD